MSMFGEYTVSKFVLVRGVSCPRCKAEAGDQCYSDKVETMKTSMGTFGFREKHASSHRERFEHFEKLATCDPLVKVSSIQSGPSVHPGFLVELLYGERLWVLGWGVQPDSFILGHLFKNGIGELTAKPVCEVHLRQILRHIELK